MKSIFEKVLDKTCDTISGVALIFLVVFVPGGRSMSKHMMKDDKDPLEVAEELLK